MKTIKSAFCKYRKTKIALCILALVILIPVIVVNVTPKPSALLVRKLFETSGATKPQDYKEVQAEVRVERDLKYPSKYELNTFDVFTPKTVNMESDRPTILWVHGGAFVGGDKRDIDFFATKLASDGYTVISMNYALAPEATYPTPVKQVSEIMVYLEKNESKWKDINLDNLFFAGDSAGAQIVTQYMLSQTIPAYREEMQLPQQLKRESINGMLLYCGPYDVEQLANLSSSPIIRFFIDQVGWSYIGNRNWKTSDTVLQANVITHVDENFPPSYITDANTASFEQQGKDLSVKLKGLGVEVSDRFFEKHEYEIMHEYQFKMDEKPAIIAYGDTLEFLKEFQK